VSTNNSDLNVLGVLVLDLTEESGRSDNIEGGDTKEPVVRDLHISDGGLGPTSSRQRHPFACRPRPRWGRSS
jgi:hypothetical protein